MTRLQLNELAEGELPIWTSRVVRHGVGINRFNFVYGISNSFREKVLESFLFLDSASLPCHLIVLGLKI